MARQGQPEGWNEREKDSNSDGRLPAGVEFYSTPGHGYLRVDTRIWPAKVTGYDYHDGPHHVLLEEDCSATAWINDYEAGKIKRKAPDRMAVITQGLGQQIANRYPGVGVAVAGHHVEPQARLF